MIADGVRILATAAVMAATALLVPLLSWWYLSRVLRGHDHNRDLLDQ